MTGTLRVKQYPYACAVYSQVRENVTSLWLSFWKSVREKIIQSAEETHFNKYTNHMPFTCVYLMCVVSEDEDDYRQHLTHHSQTVIAL